MTTDILLPETVTIDTLQELFEAAYLKVEKGEDGELCVVETYKIWVAPVGDGRRLHFYTLFSFSESATLLDKLEYVNLVNDKMALVRAFMTSFTPSALCIDYYVPVDGGINKRAVVFALKSFGEAVRAALHLDSTNIVS